MLADARQFKMTLTVEDQQRLGRIRVLMVTEDPTRAVTDADCIRHALYVADPKRDAAAPKPSRRSDRKRGK